MPKVTYVEFNGDEHQVDLPEGWTLMQGATLNGINGIDGECGGSCGCATCHCFIDEAFINKLEPASDMEKEMLECTAVASEPNSRLACQIKVTPELEGIVVRMPEEQS